MRWLILFISPLLINGCGGNNFESIEKVLPPLPIEDTISWKWNNCNSVDIISKGVKHHYTYDEAYIVWLNDTNAVFQGKFVSIQVTFIAPTGTICFEQSPRIITDLPSIGIPDPQYDY